MLHHNPVNGQVGDCLVVGRGAIGIRLALSSLEKKTGRVILPANICYAAVLPVLYAGYEPLFCDVDTLSGNVSHETIAMLSFENVVAAILPHMYGNPISGFPSIAKRLRSKGIVIIEDCASLMAQDGDEYIPGTVGDYVIYSTGYSKTIDIGIGGLLYSRKRELTELERLEAQLPSFDSRYLRIWSDFSKTYRELRTEGQFTEHAKSVYRELPNRFRESFSFSADDSLKCRILDSIRRLDEVIQQRRRQYENYRVGMGLPPQQIYCYSSYAVPWRFNMYVKEERNDFIRFCLERGLPVSDWYPCVTPIFGDASSFPGAERHEKQIINFPLMIPDEKIDKICNAVSAYYKGA